jgi:hypothetical protein
MVLAPLLAAAVWVPMRWFSADPASLELLSGTPVNCLLLETAQWDANFVRAAKAKKITTLAVVRRDTDAAAARRAGTDGLVLEGDFSPDVEAQLQQAVRLVSRERFPGIANQAIAGTFQGVWPGLRIDEQEPVLTGPTAAPWLDTNSGFLRVARAMTAATLWIGNRPPERKQLTLRRRLHAIADAALAGARWIVALDRDLERRLLARENKALDEWKAMAGLLGFFEEHPAWRSMKPYGRLALIMDARQGALLSGSAFDMLAVQHLPVRPVLSGQMPDAAVVLRAPPVAPQPGQFAMREQDLQRLEPFWQEAKQATGRRNLGVRVFNAASMLSNALVSDDGATLVLVIVNYTDYPAEALTVHALGNWSKAVLLEPGKPARPLTVYPVKDGVGIEIDRIGVAAAVELK